MNHVSNTTKVIVVGVAAAILIVLTIVYNNVGNQNPVDAINVTNSTSAALNAESPTQTPPIQTSSPSTNIMIENRTPGPQIRPSSAPAAPTIKFITPVLNDTWTIGTQNPIIWNTAPGVTGSISLINEATGKSVGVILPELTGTQTSYTWNTRDLLLDRTNPEKITVTPGTFMIELSFDGNNLKPVTSPEFTITN